MRTPSPSLIRLSDHDLIAALARLSRCERSATADLIAHLAELDARRLYRGLGYSSLFVYCTAALRLSEHEAYNRIEAARAARRFPVVLDRLRDGSANLTTVRLLAPHLTAANHEDLLASAFGRGRREVEELLARRFPREPVPPSVRKLPGPAPLPDAPVPEPPVKGSPALQVAPPPPPAPTVQPPPVTSPSRRAVVAPLATDQYKVTFTAKAETCRKLRLAQDLLRHQVPDGDPAEIFDRALSALLEELARKRLGSTSRPRKDRPGTPGSRHIPAAVRRAVWLRDGGRCAFVARSGRRCGEGGFLEFHHVEPYARGGEPAVSNIALRCRSHNAYEAEIDFGPRQAPGATRSGTSRARGPGHPAERLPP
jgi:hypothetical protein